MAQLTTGVRVAWASACQVPGLDGAAARSAAAAPGSDPDAAQGVAVAFGPSLRRASPAVLRQPPLNRRLVLRQRPGDSLDDCRIAAEDAKADQAVIAEQCLDERDAEPALGQQRADAGDGGSRHPGIDGQTGGGTKGWNQTGAARCSRLDKAALRRAPKQDRRKGADFLPA